MNWIIELHMLWLCCAGRPKRIELKYVLYVDVDVNCHVLLYLDNARGQQGFQNINILLSIPYDGEKIFVE